MYWYAIINNFDKFKIKNFIISSKYFYLDPEKYKKEYIQIQERESLSCKKSFNYWNNKGFSIPCNYIKQIIIDWLIIFNNDMNKVIDYYLKNYNKIKLTFFSRHILEKELGINVVPEKYYGFTLQQYGRIVGKSLFDKTMDNIFFYIYDIDYNVYDEIITKYDKRVNKNVNKFVS